MAAGEERPWSELPPEILEMIKMRLSLLECPNSFSHVCRGWRRGVPAYYPADVCPLLLHYLKAEDGVCNYYSPALHTTFVVPCPLDLSGATFRCAADGWLLLSRGESDYFLAHPLTGARRDMEDMDVCVPDTPMNFSVLSFSAPTLRSPSPSTSGTDCAVLFGIRSYGPDIVSILSCRRDGAKGSERIYYHNHLPFNLADTSPVFHRGLFYCLALDGVLGTFDPCERRWTVLANPSPVVLEGAIGESYLIKSEGEELFSVFIQRHSMRFSVFRLDEGRMQWERVARLEDNRALFVGYPVSLSAPSTESMSNKVYFPRVHGEPEIVHATLAEFKGRPMFVSEGSERRKRMGEGMCYYDLGSKEKYNFYKSYGYMFSIWYDVKNCSVNIQ